MADNTCSHARWALSEPARYAAPSGTRINGHSVLLFEVTTQVCHNCRVTRNLLTPVFEVGDGRGADDTRAAGGRERHIRTAESARATAQAA